MEIEVTIQSDVVILSLAGELVASTAEVLTIKVDKLIRKNFNRIIIDMEKVTFMDSSGLGVCMTVHNTVFEKGGKLAFVQPGEKVTRVFRMTHADKKLTIAPSVKEGLICIAGQGRA